MPAQDVLVIGLGYVGIPLAVQAARAGFRVTGYDTSAEIAGSLNAGLLLDTRGAVRNTPPALHVEASDQAGGHDAGGGVVPNTTYVPDVAAPPGDDRRVVYVGHLSPDRGTADMIELARLLRPRGITMELTGPADARARAQIEPAQAAGLLRWRGFVPNDQAMPMLDGALAGLSLLHDEPNFRHSLPTKVVEYMARGVPVVTTPLPAAAELARGHQCGFVVPFGDPRAAAGAVLELDRDISLRAEMGRRGHEVAHSSLGWPSDAREFVAQLESWAKEKLLSGRS